MTIWMFISTWYLILQYSFFFNRTGVVLVYNLFWQNWVLFWWCIFFFFNDRTRLSLESTSITTIYKKKKINTLSITSILHNSYVLFLNVFIILFLCLFWPSWLSLQWHLWTEASGFVSADHHPRHLLGQREWLTYARALCYCLHSRSPQRWRHQELPAQGSYSCQGFSGVYGRDFSCCFVIFRVYCYIEFYSLYVAPILLQKSCIIQILTRITNVHSQRVDFGTATESVCTDQYKWRTFPQSHSRSGATIDRVIKSEVGCCSVFIV